MRIHYLGHSFETQGLTLNKDSRRQEILNARVSLRSLERVMALLLLLKCLSAMAGDRERDKKLRNLGMLERILRG